MGQRPTFAPKSMLLCDFDGVVLDSFANHCRVTNALLAVLGEGGLRGRADEKARFTLEVLTKRYGAAIADALLNARPALMAATIDRAPVVHGAVEAIASIDTPVSLVTAGFGAAATRRLGTDAELFYEIVGCEAGDKTDLLRARAADARAYLTDTVADVRRCAAVGIAAIGVAWGFDNTGDLMASGAVHVVDSPADLRVFLLGGAW